MEGLISGEQSIFADAVKRFAAKEYGLGPAPHKLAFDKARFGRLGELGCLALAIPTEFGGIGGPVEAMVAMGALGPALAPEPLVASGIHAAALIAAAAPVAVAKKILPGMAEGRIIAVVADLENDLRYDRQNPKTVARRSGQGFVLNGIKPMTPFAAEADYFVVSAKGESGTGLFLVEAGSAGIARARCSRIDGMSAADLTLLECIVPHDARLDAMPAADALSRAVDIATAAQMAEMVGIMDALIAATIDYARTRRQFGVAIGSFQALQHRIADMWIACEESRSLAAAAALACTDTRSTRENTISAAMIVANDAADRVGNEAIQIHGGIGMTDELIVSHWYRRLWALRQELGDRRYHVARLAAAA